MKFSDLMKAGVLSACVSVMTSASAKPAMETDFATDLATCATLRDGVWVLNADFPDGNIYYTSSDLTIDLNGHVFKAHGLDGNNSIYHNVVIKNSGGNLSEIYLSANVGGSLVIEENVSLSIGHARLFVGAGGLIKICSGARFESYCHWTDHEGKFELESGCQVSSAVVEFIENHNILSDGQVLGGPDGNGYYLVSNASQSKDVSTSGITFAADVTTTADSWTVESMEELLPLAHSVNAWGATSAAPKATITYTFNGGEPQMLGSYSDDDPPAEWPVRNGTYVFTHQPGGLTKTVTVNMPIVKLLSVQQRYPWNGIVDYTYMLDGLSGDKTYKLAVGLTVNGETKATTNDLTTIATGDYSGTLNAAELFPGKYGTKGKLKLSVLKENK